jgi:HEAT repeat protein
MNAILLVCLFTTGQIVTAADNAQLPEAESIRIETLNGLRDPDPEIVWVELAFLKDSNRWRRQSVMSELLKLADHESADIRGTALECLAEIGPPAAAALPLAERRLRDPDPMVRVAAASALWKIGRRGDLAAPVLIDAMRVDDETQSVLDVATSILQLIGPAASGSWDQLKTLLDDRREAVREYACIPIGALGPEHRELVSARLIHALQDPASGVRIAAATALNHVDGPIESALDALMQISQLEPPLTPVLADSEWYRETYASCAIKALGEFEGDATPAVKVLAKCLDSRIRVVRLEAATALGRIGPSARDAIPALSRALRESYVKIKRDPTQYSCVGNNAAIALGLIGPEAVTTLLSDLEDQSPDVRAKAALALGDIAEAASRTVVPLSRRLADVHASVRIAAAKAIGRLGPAAVEAAPELAKLLVDPAKVPSIDPNLPVTDTETVCEVALQALSSLQAEADQVMPAVALILPEADHITCEFVAVLRLFPQEARGMIEPLKRLLQKPKTRVGAACALAFVDSRHPEIRAILEDALFHGDQPHSLAALGLGRLAERGLIFDDEFISRFADLAGKSNDLFLRSSLLRMRPEDSQVADRLLEAMRDRYPVFDRISIREAERTLIDLSTAESVAAALVRELNFAPNQLADGYGAYSTQHEHLVVPSQLRAARILIAAQIAPDEVLQRLKILSEYDAWSIKCAVADQLANMKARLDAASAILMPMLEENWGYQAKPVFSGDGGKWHIVGDRAALALAKLNATQALTGQLDNRSAEVRIRIVRALGSLGPDALTPQLLLRARDLDPRVRRETMTALGRLAQSHPDLQPKLRGPLQSAAEDRRLSVRDAAQRSLASWRAE